MMISPRTQSPKRTSRSNVGRTGFSATGGEVVNLAIGQNPMYVLIANAYDALTECAYLR